MYVSVWNVNICHHAVFRQVQCDSYSGYVQWLAWQGKASWAEYNIINTLIYHVIWVIVGRTQKSNIFIPPKSGAYLLHMFSVFLPLAKINIAAARSCDSVNWIKFTPDIKHTRSFLLLLTIGCTDKMWLCESTAGMEGRLCWSSTCCANLGI